MAKLINVQAYPINGVPDHLINECQETGEAITKLIWPLLKDKNPNIILGAVAFLHSALIKEFVSDDPAQQSQAAKLASAALCRNVSFLNKMPLLEFMESSSIPD